MPVRYAVRAGALRWRRWDDDMVVLDTTVACTHLLAPAAAEVLQALIEAHPEALDAAELAHRLLPGEGDAPQREDDVQALDTLLLQLARLGLVAARDAPAP